MIQKGSRTKIFFDDKLLPIKLISKKGIHHVPGSKSLEKFLNAEDADYIDFISKCLEWDPSKRMKPDDAICHKWITSS